MALKICAAFSAAFLISGCASALGTVDGYRVKSFKALEDASLSAGQAAQDYLCDGIRVGALRRLLRSETERASWRDLCLQPGPLQLPQDQGPGV
ncbi:MAG: hypothetical protein ACPGO3_09855 [Magnetospiraceae bacterium]